MSESSPPAPPPQATTVMPCTEEVYHCRPLHSGVLKQVQPLVALSTPPARAAEAKRDVTTPLVADSGSRCEGGDEDLADGEAKGKMPSVTVAVSPEMALGTSTSTPPDSVLEWCTRAPPFTNPLTAAAPATSSQGDDLSPLEIAQKTPADNAVEATSYGPTLSSSESARRSPAPGQFQQFMSNPPRYVTDASAEPEGEAAEQSNRSLSSRIRPRRASKADLTSELTEEEQRRITRSVEDTVRLNYATMFRSHSPTMSLSVGCPAASPISSGDSSAAPLVTGVLLNRSRLEAGQPSQSRLSGQPLQRASTQGLPTSPYGARPRRHSTHGRMSSAETLYPNLSPVPPSEGGATSAAVASRLSLAKLGRGGSSSEQLDGMARPVSVSTGDESDAEISDLFTGSACASAVVVEGTKLHSVVRPADTALPSRSPVSILYRSSSIADSGASSPDLHFSLSDRREDVKSPISDSAWLENSLFASPTSGQLVEDVNKGWSRRCSHRGSRLRKPSNGRDTPRAVGFIGDEIVGDKVESQSEHEQLKKRILEKMRSRRASSTTEPL